MSTRRTILSAAQIDVRKYLEEKPSSCNYCYWWQGKNKGCILPECYYLMPTEVKKPKKKTACDACSYGKQSPCIGYCISKLLKEVREGKGGVQNGTNGPDGS